MNRRIFGMTRCRVMMLASTFACVALVNASQVFAQAGHGVSIFKQCAGPKCVGEDTNCEISVAHADIFGDTTEILEAFDTMTESGVRVPAAGNLEIVSVLGNTTCTVGGALPCTIGPGVDGGLPGIVTFSSVHTITLADVECVGDCTAPNQATVRVRDECDSPTTINCSSQTISTVQFTAATPITVCSDGLNCTLDCCANGVCSYESVCEGAVDCRGSDGTLTTFPPLNCEDGLGCTVDSCNAANEPTCCDQGPLCPPDAECCADGESCDDQNACTDDICVEDECCANIPVVCPPRACNEVVCDTAVGCVYTPDCLTGADCADGNACTDDVCTEGCCSNPPIVCEPRDCNTVECNPAVGCVYTPDCLTGADCNDQNACTDDVCTEGCCSNPPIVCNDNDPCTTDTCNPATGCVYTPECTSDGDCEESPPNLCTTNTCVEGCCESTPVVCDDGDPCTENNCNPQTGCEYPPIEPPPAECVAGDGCTPGFWKQPHHLQYWVGYSPSELYDTVFGVTSTFAANTLLEVLQQGGGGEIALGRHAVAALLNSTNGDVDYAYTTAEVIAMVQAAYASGDFNGAKSLLSTENERGCTVIKTNLGGGDRSSKGKPTGR